VSAVFSEGVLATVYCRPSVKNRLVEHQNSHIFGGWGGCTCNYCAEEEEYMTRELSDEEFSDEEFQYSSKSPTSVIQQSIVTNKQPIVTDKFQFDQLNVFTCLKTGVKTYEDGSRVPDPKTKEELEREKQREEFRRFNELGDLRVKQGMKHMNNRITNAILIQKMCRGLVSRFKYFRLIGYHYRPQRLVKVIKLRPSASSKYYTWKKGNKATNTSRNAWGHRRNGGSKNQVALSKQSKILTEKDMEMARLARKERRLKSKETRELELEKAKARELEFQKRKLMLEKENSEVAQPPVVVEETEWQKFKREELEMFKQMVREKKDFVDPVQHAEKDTEPSKTHHSKRWNVISRAQKIKQKIALGIEQSMYNKSSYRTCRHKSKPNVTDRIIMCKSVGRYKCTKEDCRYAHSRKELNIKTCFTGAKCKRVCLMGGVVVSQKNAPSCCFFHPSLGETYSSYYNRLRIPLDRPSKEPADKTSIVRNTSTPPIIKSTWGPPLTVKTEEAPVRKSRWGPPIKTEDAVVRKSRWTNRKTSRWDKRTVTKQVNIQTKSRKPTWVDIVKKTHC
jgi:hypothetical protein